MGKILAGSQLSLELKNHRKALHLTQGELAGRVKLAERTIRLLEQGRGSLDSWERALRHLELRLVGRNLPAGNTLGEKLSALRRHRGFSLRELASLSNLSKPTIMALERDNGGRLSALERLLTTLGAGAYLAPRGEARAFFTHAGNSSMGESWETPAALLEVLVSVFGHFDLDPCSPKKTRARVRARRHFTAADDGLSLPWHGTVFVNPPYGRSLPRWVEKAYREVRDGHAKTVVALLPARPDTAYWHQHIARHATVYFLKGRLKFGDGRQSAPFPSALVLWGANPEVISALDAALPGAWRAR